MRQGTRIDDFRDEDPGRILHEMRYGEMTAFEERPHSPYYGCADATPLFVVLLDEYERWTGDRKLVRELEHEARAALTWIDEYADLLGNGYVSYQRRNEKTGLENQCWKDSWDSISYRDGTLPGFPRATCELQGYAYDAKVRGARLARLVWKDAGVRRPAREGGRRPEAALQPRLLGRGRRVLRARARRRTASRSTRSRRTTATCSGAGSSTSRRRRRSCAHLMGPRLFSGWGVRTLAEGEGRYNPIGYHVGTVWPFDNSFIAWGLRRYGFKEEAARDRGGHPRRRGVLRRPPARGVRRLRALGDEVSRAVPDRVQPAGVVDRHAAAPAPHDARPRAARRAPHRRSGASDGIGQLELLDIPGRWGRVDAFGRGRVDGSSSDPLGPQTNGKALTRARARAR